MRNKRSACHSAESLFGANVNEHNSLAKPGVPRPGKTVGESNSARVLVLYLAVLVLYLAEECHQK